MNRFLLILGLTLSEGFVTPNSWDFPASNRVLISESDRQRSSFLSSVDNLEVDTSGVFQGIPEDVSLKTRMAFGLLRESVISRYYALACLENSADYFGWMTDFANHLVERSIDTALAPHPLDAVLIGAQASVGETLGSNVFPLLVAVLEWRVHPGGLRNRVQNIFIVLIELNDARSRSAAPLFRRVLAHLSPSLETVYPYEICWSLLNEIWISVHSL